MYISAYVLKTLKKIIICSECLLVCDSGKSADNMVSYLISGQGKKHNYIIIYF